MESSFGILKDFTSDDHVTTVHSPQGMSLGISEVTFPQEGQLDMTWGAETGTTNIMRQGP